jgi:hypothetical protein
MIKSLKIKMLIISGLWLAAGGYYFLFHSEFREIDSCLDAGGRWLKSEKRCVQQ